MYDLIALSLPFRKSRRDRPRGSVMSRDGIMGFCVAQPRSSIASMPFRRSAESRRSSMLL